MDRKLVRVCLLVFNCCAFVAVHHVPAYGFTPESDTVRAMVRRAVRYLGSDPLLNTEVKALSAMALFKAGEDLSHPLITQALQECVERCHSPESISQTFDIYATSVVGLLFCEVDPQKYQSEIANVIESLEARQKPFGGWGYPKPLSNWEFGDTSMTQYAVLCAWMARTTGAAQISQDATRKVTNWLIRTQDPSGAWGYQGRDPGVGNLGRRVRQSDVRHSLCAAGVGSLYICANLLGFTSADGGLVSETDVPAAFKPVVTTKLQPDSLVDRELLMRAMRDGDRWYAANYRINPVEYTHYYLYTLERYQSFKELAEGRVSREPRWYNDGVRMLRSTQDRRGFWDDPKGTTKVADTCFAVFFLVRSAKRTLAKSNEYSGLLVAGQGLPGNTQNIQMRRGKVVRTPFQGTANALLEILSDASHPDFEAATQPQALELSSEPSALNNEVRQLRQLVRAESYRARLVAVKTLARLRDLDQVPTLIYALSDPDLRVVKAARDGLRFTSRKFAGFGLSDDPTPTERELAIEAWQNWYVSIRPNAKFEAR